MDAAHDYAAATRLLHTTFPAYVSYLQHAHVKVGPIDKHIDSTLVVRTSDGKIIKGTSTSVRIGADSDIHGDVVTRQIFKPDCYRPVSAAPGTYAGRPVEAIALHRTCASEGDGKGSQDFSTLYVDERTLQPLGVMGGSHDDKVDATIEERFQSVGGRMVPAALSVEVAGKGWMGWLQVLAHVDYSQYRFFDQEPK
jgi:hypothetical protein